VTPEGRSSVVEDNAQDGTLDLKAAIVFDETHFLEFIHEEINPAASCRS
jgi:hypothetical protein